MVEGGKIDRVVWFGKARKSYRNIYLYISNKFGIRHAVEFKSRVSDTIIKLTVHPYLGRKEYNDIRSMSVTKHTRIFYSIKDNTLEIILVNDGRKPVNLSDLD